ncbi:MAG TPA: ribonuclease M5 [Acholeplasmatales bacterium]|nr:ribonuclease M5 [Bacillota bacterium]HAQ56744.1 ribonuclease M5 [Acholeplasmatales bacterium]
MFTEIIVVEGAHDKQKLESLYPGVQCIVTNGSEIADTTIALIQNAAAVRGVILFLDPDHPGRKITDRIVAEVPGAKIAFIPRRDAISANGRKVGVEHATADAIDAALKGVYTIRTVPEGALTVSDLYARGLAGTIEAAKRREIVSQRLGLPTSNAKTLLKWLNMLGISAERLDG